MHEQLAMQWLLPSSHGSQDLQQSAWFFFELMVKAMVEHLATTARLGAPRKSRFSETFHNDVINLGSGLIFSWRNILSRRDKRASLHFHGVKRMGAVFNTNTSQVSSITSDIVCRHKGNPEM